ncbi:MAG: Pvc16 family protein [Desulfamplus sp.]
MLKLLDDTIKEIICKTIDSNLNFSFKAPTADWSGKLNTGCTVNCYFYQIKDALQLNERSRTIQRMPSKEGNFVAGIRVQPPIYMDCHYLITVWNHDYPEEEHHLLWKILSILYQQSEIAFSGSDSHLRSRIGRQDSAEFNSIEFWSSMQNPVRPSIQWIVTVPMELDNSHKTPARLVQDRIFKYEVLLDSKVSS